jgi:pyruvate dehydrogenase complex dehydrogenase (E1) component
MQNASTVEPATIRDEDPRETQEWLQAFEGVLHHAGSSRAAYLLNQLETRAQELGVAPRTAAYSSYRNTISLDQQTAHPGDVRTEERIAAIVRWNALAMVVRANRAYGELGGHLASYASAAEIFEIGFNHFFRASNGEQDGDLVFFQPHSAPGVYARAFLEGRLSEECLENYRQEIGGQGLSSYCHPWLMPGFWQFPTGSMGLGPLSAIYHARFMRYLEHRSLLRTSDRHVWGVFGDGEMDEPESIAALTLASRENLDNLTFVVNCNLQRLDGPVRGNGQIIQELERLFVGAGWNVIKVIWGSGWDPLFARDASHALLRRFASTVDGQYQTLGANDGAYNQVHFFAADPELRRLVAHMSAEEIDALRRGGHDFRKLYAAFAAARAHRGQPTLILAKTKKGYGMGGAGESRMTAHQEKKLDIAALLEFRNRFDLPLSDEDVAHLRFLRPADGGAGRTTLGGEGLQHQDGSSHLVATTVPNCRAYDPAFAYEFAVIFDYGMRRMLQKGVDEFYYITVMNENYAQPSLPSNCSEGIINGLYCISAVQTHAAVRLVGSGAILREAIAAADLLFKDWDIAAEVWSATSFSELARDAREVARWNRLHPGEASRKSHVATCLSGDTPVIAATDYVSALPQSVAAYVDAAFIVLGTDGFGRSDTRARLRRFFEVDRYHIAVSALHALVHRGSLSIQRLTDALRLYDIDSDSNAPWRR